MEAVRIDDARAFLEVAGPFARRAEGRNQLLLAIAANAAVGRRGFGPFRGWAIVEGDAVAAAAVQTPPRNPVIADPVSDDAVRALVDVVASDVVDAPGVTGTLPAVERFVEVWTSRSGDRSTVTIRQGVWELDTVERVERPRGRAGPATLEEADLVTTWFVDFEVEAIPHHEAPRREDVRADIEDRISDGRERGVWVWRDGGTIASTAGFGGPTGTGVRIGPVYTPPAHRGRGYATALVADLSSHLLANGHERCFLYTDLSNPTANHIYATIGYRRIAESRMYAFER